MTKRLIYIVLLASFLVVLLASSRKEDSDDVSLAVNRFKAFYTALAINYVDTLLHEELIKKAIYGTIDALDPHSHYYDPEETQQRRKRWKGILYGGIGANVKSTSNGVKITYCRKGYGADSVGLWPGDIFTHINDTSLKGFSFKEVLDRLRGEPHTEVNITVQRGDKQLTKNIIRKQIINQSIPYATLDSNGIATIKVDQFLEGGGSRFRSILEDYGNQKLRGVVVDLRGNPGGLLKGSVAFASTFLAEKSLVCRLKGQDPKSNYDDRTKQRPINLEVPVVLLINGNTISAAEVLSGTLQDHDRAVLVGTKTWGKGLVQGTRGLSDGASLYITAARYYLPSGRCIQERDYTNEYIIASSSNNASIYYTSNGRAVMSRDGIQPDVEMKNAEVSDFVKKVKASGLVIDYAINYRRNMKNGNQMPVLSAKDYGDYISFLSQNVEKVISDTDKSLEKLKQDENASLFQKELRAMAKKSSRKKKELIRSNAPDLKEELNRTLMKHISHLSGLYAYDLHNDDQYHKALELIKDTVAYNKILEK